MDYLKLQPALFPFHILCTIYLALCFILIPSYSFASDPPSNKEATQKLLPLVKNGSVLLQQIGQTPVVSLNPDTLYIPASIWKIATASCAFSVLGPDYRFKTEIYQTGSGDIFVKGYGDPFMVSEEIDMIEKEIQGKFISILGDVFIDQSFFDLSGQADGAGVTLNPYDAGNFALAVNFNTLNIVQTGKGLVRSAEKQTPDLPIMQLFSHGIGNGQNRINISENSSHVSRYASELFAQKIAQKISQHRKEHIYSKPVPDGAQLILTHYSSRDLLEVVREMLLYSNNFIANQIFLVLGAHNSDSPATWQKGQKVMDLFLQKNLGLANNSFTVQEGSGLSRKNRVTATGMLAILNHFRPYAHTLPEKNGIFLKSGTLTGVYSYAGYLDLDKTKSPFVIMLNQKENSREEILALLKKFGKELPSR